MPKLIRITTVPMALHVLLKGQMRYMNEHGLEVIMVSADGRERDAVLKDEGCVHKIVPMTRQITPLKDLIALYRLVRLFKKEKPDIIHSHTPKAGLLAMIAGRFAGVQIRIHTVAGLRFMTASGFTRKLLIRMEKLTAKFSTHIWPNSFSLLQYIIDNKLMPLEKVEVIGKGSSNGINLKRYSPAMLQLKKLEAIKKSIQYNENFTYLLCVGRIVKDKGIDELVKAFVHAYKNNEQIRLLLVGEYEDKLDPVSSEARKILRDHPGIIMAGWSEDVEYYMSISTALLHPSYREGFPNVILQAGAMGCPVICSRIPGNIDIVEHQKTGLLFTVRKEDELLKELQYALSHPKLLAGYALNLREKIEIFFNQDVVHQLLYKRYLQLLEAAA